MTSSTTHSTATATLASLSARVADLLQLERTAFQRLYDAEAVWTMAPARPSTDDLPDDKRQAVMQAWWRAMDEFEDRAGITSASRAFDRVTRRLAAAVDALAVLRPADPAGLIDKARVAALVRAEHGAAEWTLRLENAMADDLRALAAAV